jgi:hypothetical protein
MGHTDERYAAAVRDHGLRTVTRMTWRAGVIGVVCSVLIAGALGHGSRPAQARRGRPGTVLIPGQPPAPAQGTGQVTSGAS